MDRYKHSEQQVKYTCISNSGEYKHMENEGSEEIEKIISQEEST